MLKFAPIFMVLIFLGISCASLTERGKKVKYVTKQEADSGCEELGEVVVGEGLSMGEINISQLKIQMRNKTAEMGGNFLVIDTIDKNSNGKSYYYSGTGRAYKCP